MNRQTKREELAEKKRQAAQDRLGHLLSTRRWCYWIPADGYVEGKGFRVSIVVENESGHFPTGSTPEGGMQEPWFWGHDYKEARATAALENMEKLGLDEKATALIVMSSMGASRRAGSAS